MWMHSGDLSMYWANLVALNAGPLSVTDELTDDPHR